MTGPKVQKPVWRHRELRPDYCAHLRPEPFHGAFSFPVGSAAAALQPWPVGDREANEHAIGEATAIVAEARSAGEVAQAVGHSEWRLRWAPAVAGVFARDAAILHEPTTGRWRMLAPPAGRDVAWRLCGGFRRDERAVLMTVLCTAQQARVESYEWMFSGPLVAPWDSLLGLSTQAHAVDRLWRAAEVYFTPTLYRVADDPHQLPRFQQLQWTWPPHGRQPIDRRHTTPPVARSANEYALTSQHTTGELAADGTIAQQPIFLARYQGGNYYLRLRPADWRVPFPLTGALLDLWNLVAGTILNGNPP